MSAMGKVADPLRTLADEVGLVRWDEGGIVRKMREIADRIDADHERRMEQARRETRRAACRYLAGVVEDYKHGVKRGRS